VVGGGRWGYSQNDAFGLVFASFAAVVATPAATTEAGFATVAVPSVGAAASGFLCLAIWKAASALMTLSTKLPDDVEKGLFDVDTVLGRSLNEVAAKVFGQSLALLGGDFTLGNAIALVPNQHDRGLAENGSWGSHGGAGVGRGASHGRLLDALDLAVEALDSSKRGARWDAVDEDEAFSIAYPLVAQGNVLLLAGCVEDFEHARLAVNLNLLAVRVFNSGIVGLDEMVQTKLGESAVSQGCSDGGRERGRGKGKGEKEGATYLDSQGGLADAAVAKDHQFVQRHLARHGCEFGVGVGGEDQGGGPR
jgi:hypothetical protein